MFATVMCLVLPMCILTSCSSVLCVLIDGLGNVYVCESYVVLDQCDEPPSLFMVMMSGWVMCTRCFSFRFCF